MLKSAMPSLCRVLVPEVLPAVMPDVPVVPEFLPAPPPQLVLPSRVPADLPPEGRAVLAAALAGPLPAAKREEKGELVREAVPCRWDDAEIARLRGFLRTVEDLRGRQGRVYPLEYLAALPLLAGMAGDGELDGRGVGRDRAGTAPGQTGRAAGPGWEAAPPGRRHHPPRPHGL